MAWISDYIPQFYVDEITYPRHQFSPGPENLFCCWKKNRSMSFLMINWATLYDNRA